MKLNTHLMIVLLIFGIFNLLAQDIQKWPESINKLEASLCLVEYFQPQFEMGEIKDKSRIKRTITGILVNEEGLVLTSDVIYPANLDIVETSNFYISTQPLPEDITVSFVRDKKLKAEFLGKDEDLRLAFIKITEEADLPPPVEFIEETDLSMGDPLLVIQHLNGRFDFEKFITAHHINAIIEKPKKKLLTTNSINPLSPGGLVTTLKGQPVGIVYRGENYYVHYDYDYDAPYNNETLMQIIPTDQFIRLLENPPVLLAHSEGSGKSWLGIQMQILTKRMAAYWDLDNTSGIIINKVSPGSPAEKAGLQKGDILISIGDLKFHGYDKKNLDILRTYVRNQPEGKIQAALLRHHKQLTLDITLESAPKSRFLAEEYSDQLLGLGVKELTQDYIISNDLDFNTNGVWVSRVEDGGAGSLAGIEVNDLILQINGKIVKNLEDFKRITAAIPKSKDIYVEVFLNRQGKTRFVFIKTLPNEDL
jgi:serine protease Do